MQVFISYKREDETFARQLSDHIESWGYRPWLDVTNIPAGADWDSSIHAGLKSSNIVVGVLTPESLASENVMDEWGYALSTGKRLFLLWLRDVPEADVPPRYIRIQRIDLRRGDSVGMKSLQQALLSAAKIVPLVEGIADGSAVPQYEPSLSSPQTERTEEEKPLKEALPAQARSNRQRMLEKVQVFWVEGVLEQSVYGAALIELGIQTKQGVVENPWDTILQHNTYGDYRLPSGSKIDEVYHDLNNELLILGDPGSGKTTTMLELARDRIALAEEDETQPIPVIFNLSSWADKRVPLADWLTDELNTKYQVPRKVAQDWIDTDALLLLLDGLDEVDSRYRDACVTAINTFRSERGFTPIVVCSRIADYEALSTRLKLNGAIVLQPLDQEQIDRYLAHLGPDMQGIRDAMSTDTDLSKLAESPLMLSIMTLAFHGLKTADLPHLDSIEAQRQRLFETYTRRMFERRKSHWFTPEQTLHYLKWLAGRMVEHKQSVFYIENLQLDWLPTLWQQILFRFLSRITFGILGGIFVGAVSFSFIGLGLALLTGNQAPRVPESDIVGIGAVPYTILIGILIGVLTGGIGYGLLALLVFARDCVMLKSKWRAFFSPVFLAIPVTGFFVFMMVSLAALSNGSGIPFYNSQNNILLFGPIVIDLVVSVIIGLTASILVRIPITSLRILALIYGFVIVLVPYLVVSLLFSSGFRDIIIIFSLSPLIAFPLFLLAGHKDLIETAEQLGWRLQWRWGVLGFGVGIAFAVFDVINLNNCCPTISNIQRFVDLMLIVGIPGFFIGVIAGGLRRSEIVDMRILPNQGIWRTVRNMLRLILIFSLMGLVIALVFEILNFTLQGFGDMSALITLISDVNAYRHTEFVSYILAGPSIGFAAGLILGGGDTIIKHWVLRLFLQRNDSIPRNYARFLDYATERILLRKVGGGYIFIHRYLLEYFASLESSPTTKTNN